MSLHLRILRSGSSGNLTLVENDAGARMLIDVGVTRSALLAELDALSIDVRSLAGAVLTHAHGDHANPGALALLDAVGVPVHATPGTWAAVAQRAGTPIRGQSAADLHPGRALAIAGMTVHACRVSHDNGTAGDAVCFRVETGSEALGYATDLGTVDDAVLANLRGVGLLVLESNHDVDMLAQTDRPYTTRAWIRGERGHLRNEQASAALADLFDGREGGAAVLAHLSGQANTPERALACARAALRGRAEIAIGVATGEGLRARWSLHGGNATFSPYTPPLPSAGIFQPVTTRGYTCGGCGGSGHNRLTCPSRVRTGPFRATPPATTTSSPRSPSGLRRAYRCSSCGETGHNAATCGRADRLLAQAWAG